MIYSTWYAFAALKTDGSVVTWGNSRAGGNSYVNDGHPNYNNITNVSSSLSSGVVVVYSANYAFAALKTDGSVVAWGAPSMGGDCSMVQAELAADVQSIYGNDIAFAAVKIDSDAVVNYGQGHSKFGGNCRNVKAQLVHGVHLLFRKGFFSTEG